MVRKSQVQIEDRTVLMAVDPLKNMPLNRGTQLKREGNELGKGVRLYDVDLAIAEHMIDTIVLSVEAY